MMAAKILWLYLSLLFRLAIYTPGAKMWGFPKILPISGRDVVLNVVSGRICVNNWINSWRNRLFNLNVFVFSLSERAMLSPNYNVNLPHGWDFLRSPSAKRENWHQRAGCWFVPWHNRGEHHNTRSEQLTTGVEEFMWERNVHRSPPRSSATFSWSVIAVSWKPFSTASWFLFQWQSPSPPRHLWSGAQVRLRPLLQWWLRWPPQRWRHRMWFPWQRCWRVALWWSCRSYSPGS